MKPKGDERQEKDNARNKKSSARNYEKDYRKNGRKVTSESKDEEKKTELNRKHHRTSTKNSRSSCKPLQESKITSSEKVKSGSGNSGFDNDGMEVTLKRVWHHWMETTTPHSQNEKEEVNKHKNKSNGRKGSHHLPIREKNTDNEDCKMSKSRSENDWKNKTSKVSSDDKSDEIYEENEELQTLESVSGCRQDCLPVENHTEVREENHNAEKTAEKEHTVSSTKYKQGQEKKRKSHSKDHDKLKKNKKFKREEDEDKKKQKGNKESKKAEEAPSKWKWWEEGKHTDGQKWKSLEHKGPLFPPEYEHLPSSVPFLYDGEPVKLSMSTEEVATFYAKMLDHEYTSKETFQSNFFTDWREVMTEDERKLIKKLSKCDFSHIHSYFVKKAEEKKNMTKEEKQVLKEETDKLTEEYGYCLLDGHKEKIGNFRLEPPGLFRGRGEHPKMGKLKKRVQPEDVIINCSQDTKIPEPPSGHRWKRVQHDNTVTWLASWVENIHGHIKYIMLNPSSKLKGEKDWQKYETARKLKLRVDGIRSEYRRAWRAREMKQRQRGVALYFIDKLALRAGNEKDDDTADTVGCCSLRVEHITLHHHLDGQDYVVEFDFLGKDSIRYYNKVPVEKQVYKNLKLFMEFKGPEDDLFDRISTTYLNKKLNEAMPGLTAKVFRTFNASTTLQEQLSKLTVDDMTVEEKILAYNRANRAVAILCNHQRAAPKTFEKSMQTLQEKIRKKKEDLENAKKELKQAKKAHKECPTEKTRKLVEKKEKAVKRLAEQLKKLQLQETDREENKVIALGTSKLNYLDPRITVAWCKKHRVPVEKIYNKTQRDKFAWAIDMTDEHFQF
ncbi:DNA topoisomerase I, mitochondrial [Electrophorus electricus]|uniref:DNA topoisomerase I, mitochondrial n=1 Tax=Electrophorus electricus TaxID=8005 RepID=UPI000F0A6783|nr:DNA topoisomerase I, mitochondrial [Electrophorus electricus]